MEKNTRKCSVCGKEFVPCGTCGRKDVDEALMWRRVVCCPEHFAFHLALVRFERGSIDGKTAYDEIRRAAENYDMPEFCGSAGKTFKKIKKG